jgi:hypothetical protein
MPHELKDNIDSVARHPGELIPFSRYGKREDFDGYRGECFGKPETLTNRDGITIDVRRVSEGSILYNGQPLKKCEEYVLEDRPLWLGSYVTASAYSVFEHLHGDVSPLKTEHDLVLFDILSKDNLEKLLEFHKGDLEKCYNISTVTGYNLDYSKHPTANSFLTQEGVPIDQVRMTDACGVSYIAGKAGIDRSSENASTDTSTLIAIREFCERLGLIVHGWHQSETPRLRDGNVLPAEVALWNPLGCVKTECNNTDRLHFHTFVKDVVEDLKDENMKSQGTCKRMCEAFNAVKDKLPHVQCLTMQTADFGSNQSGHVLTVFIQLDRTFELDTSKTLRVTDIPMSSVMCIVTSFYDILFPTVIWGNVARRFLRKLHNDSCTWEQYFDALGEACSNEYFYYNVSTIIDIESQFDYKVCSCAVISLDTESTGQSGGGYATAMGWTFLSGVVAVMALLGSSPFL